MTRELTTELVVVSLVPPMGPRTSTSTFGCNKHDCFTPHRLLSIPSSVFLGPSHLPSHWFLLPFLLFLTLSFGCDFLSLTHPCNRCKDPFRTIAIADHHDHVRHTPWVAWHRACEVPRGLPILTTRATNAPWNESKEKRTPWRWAGTRDEGRPETRPSELTRFRISSRGRRRPDAPRIAILAT